MPIKSNAPIDKNDWYCMAHLPNFKLPDFAEGESLDLGYGVSIRPIPGWVTDSALLDGIDKRAHNEIAMDALFCLWYEYNDVCPTSPSPLFWGKERPISWVDVVHLLYSMADLAFWLKGPNYIQFNTILHFNHSSYLDADCIPFVRYSIFQPQTVSDEPPSTIDPDSYNHVSHFFVVLCNILNNSSPAAVSTGSLLTWRALTTRPDSIKYLLLWVALEAMFGPETHGRITDRLSKRISAFLSMNNSQCQSIFEKAKQAYGYRCFIAHGFKSSRQEEFNPDELLTYTKMFVRKSLIIILKNKEILDNFEPEKRESYLNKLVERII